MINNGAHQQSDSELRDTGDDCRRSAACRSATGL